MRDFQNDHAARPAEPRSSKRLCLIGCAMAAALVMVAAPGAALAAPPTIVLIGGMKQGLPDAEHDFPDGALKIERLIKASPEFAKVDPIVKVFPAGFPKDLSQIEDANVVVLYTGTHRTDAGSANPLQAPAVKQAMGKLMDRGVGLVALHQAFTVSTKDDVPFLDWLGGVRIAVTDYTVETAPVTIATQAHPIANGLKSFDYLDEFYPTIDFGSDPKVVPILSARIHVQHRKAGPAFVEPPANRVVAWAHERAGGGRSFAFSGGHNLAAFDQPQVRTTVLNAILWAARAKVPEAGVTTALPFRLPGGRASAPDALRVVLPASEAEQVQVPWGKLEWFASRPLGNSTTMTVGKATIPPKSENPPHWHPNTDEVLHVLQGHIMHRVGDKEYEMKAGDTVTIPEGTIHNARNIGSEDAVLFVSFNSADRYSLGE